MTKFLTPKRVCEIVAFSRATLDRQVAAGEFPAPIRLTKRRIAFREAEVFAWMDEREVA